MKQDPREYLARTKGIRYPFDGHKLAEQDNYVKNLYLKHLSMLLCCGKVVSEEQTLFFQRLIAGCKGEYDLETYMRQGQEVSPESLEEFLEAIPAKNLRDIFFLDALLLAHLGPQDEEQEELLVALCEAIQMKRPVLEQLADLSGRILRLKLFDCVETEFWEEHQIQSELWRPYFLNATDTIKPK